MQTLPSGFKSSEFYLSFIPMVVSMLVITGVIGPEYQQQAEEAFKVGVAGIVAIVSVISYVLNRHDLKKSVIEANIESKQLVG